MKKLTLADLKSFRDSLKIPISDEVLEANSLSRRTTTPAEDEAVAYALERRGKLGGLPSRRTTHPGSTCRRQRLRPGQEGLGQAERRDDDGLRAAAQKDLMRDKEFGPRIVPIIPDEARTFGMDSFFPTIKIYNPHGQRYTSVDADLMLAYKRVRRARSSTSASTRRARRRPSPPSARRTRRTDADDPDLHLLLDVRVPADRRLDLGGRRPDDAWIPLIGATAGRTTLTGEGLQHADGHSHLLAATNPAVRAYDPAFAYEIDRTSCRTVCTGCTAAATSPRRAQRHLLPHRVQRADAAACRAGGRRPGGILRDTLRPGHHRRPAGRRAPRAVARVGSRYAVGPEAQELLRDDWGVCRCLVGHPWNELRRDGLACDQQAYLHPDAEQRVPWVTQKLQGTQGPVVAVSDWMRAVQDQIREWVPGDYGSLGADGFGFSDTRPAARRVFHIDGPSMAAKALQMLADQGKVPADALARAIEKYKLHDVTAGTSGNSGGDA